MVIIPISDLPRGIYILQINRCYQRPLLSHAFSSHTDHLIESLLSSERTLPFTLIMLLLSMCSFNLCIKLVRDVYGCHILIFSIFCDTMPHRSYGEEGKIAIQWKFTTSANIKTFAYGIIALKHSIACSNHKLFSTSRDQKGRLPQSDSKFYLLIHTKPGQHRSLAIIAI